jgi:RNA polymerase sigma-70 factor, ECF subfamily
MARAGLGDEPAFRVLARRHLAPSLGLAVRITGNRSDAEEVVQEALLRVWVNAPRWTPSAAFRTWLYRVVVNLCLDRRRRVPMAPLEEAGDPPDPEPDAAARIESAETARMVADAVQALPERQRMALVLTYYQGLSNAETAAVLETTVSSVEALLVRAKRALRVRIDRMDT